MITELETALDNDQAVHIVFQKVNGDRREMTVVGHPEVVGESYTSKGSTRASNPEVKKIWSVEDSGWRSFKIDSLISIKVID